MEKDNSIYVTKQLVKEISTNQLDAVFREKFGFDYDMHDHFWEIEDDKNRSDSEPVEIDILINLLTDLKKQEE